MNTLPEQILLSGQNLLLHGYLDKDRPPSEELWKQLLFVDLRLECPTRPDYVYKNQMEPLLASVSFAQRLKSAIRKIKDEFLYLKQDEIRVRNGCFQEWQDCITRVSPLLFDCCCLADETPGGRDSGQLWQRIRLNLAHTALPSPYIPVLDNSLIRTERLNDCHTHINGTLESDWIWVMLLAHPQRAVKYFSWALTHTSCVREQYLQIDPLADSERFRKLLWLALSLRCCLVNDCDSTSPDLFTFPPPIQSCSYHHPAERWARIPASLLEQESIFLIHVYRSLSNNNTMR